MGISGGLNLDQFRFRPDKKASIGICKSLLQALVSKDLILGLHYLDQINGRLFSGLNLNRSKFRPPEMPIFLGLDFRPAFFFNI